MTHRTAFFSRICCMFAAGLLLLGVVTAQAGEFMELKKKMEIARTELVTMMLHADKRDASQQKVVKDTADAVSAFLATLKAPAGKEAAFNEMVTAWNAFKETREKELVPAILAGKDAEAKEIAGGIQKERITRCKELAEELDM